MRSRRRISNEINSGSMADIAFLLLIFFLVTTTMDSDLGILQIMSPKVENPPPPIHIPDRNVFKIMANAQDQLLIEDEEAKVEDLKPRTVAFFTNPQNADNLPQLKMVTLDSCFQAIAFYEAQIADLNPTVNDPQRELKRAQNQLITVQMIGPYKGLPKSAVVVLNHDEATSYRHYLTMQREATAAVEQLREALCQEHFKKSFKDLDPLDPEHHKMIIAARTVYPRKITEASLASRQPSVQ